MNIDDIKQMSREHLEDLVEYLLRQKETHINVAPPELKRREATAWVKGFDYSRDRLIQMAEDHNYLKSNLP
jgi:hypothetical protein